MRRFWLLGPLIGYLVFAVRTPIDGAGNAEKIIDGAAAVMGVAAAVKTAKTLKLVSALPTGMPTGENFEFEDVPVPAEVEDGGVLVELLYVAADPYMRQLIKYSFGVGKTMEGYCVARVLKSKHNSWVRGDLMSAVLPFTTVQMVSGEWLRTKPNWKLSGYLGLNNASWGLGALGMTGATAYGGLFGILKPKPGETIWVSAASGAVGQLVGQMAKLHGCRVIGSTGGAEKGRILKESFNFDVAIDYKPLNTTQAFIENVREAAPGGLDMYFENVGGTHFDAAMANFKRGGRAAICGIISQYNEAGRGGTNKVRPAEIAEKELRIQGFVSGKWQQGELNKEFLTHVGKLLSEGKLKVLETVTVGFEKWPDVFRSLFSSTNSKKGKAVVQVVQNIRPLE